MLVCVYSPLRMSLAGKLHASCLETVRVEQQAAHQKEQVVLSNPLVTQELLSLPLVAAGHCSWLLLNREIGKKHMLLFPLLIAATCCLLLNKDTAKGGLYAAVCRASSVNLTRPSVYQMQLNAIKCNPS